METSTERTKYQEVLDEFKGAYLQFWYYSITLKKLIIRLSWTDSEKVLFIFSLGTDYLRGKSAFCGAELQISSCKNEFGEIETLLSDMNAGFELLSSGGIVMRYGTKSENLP